MGPDSPITGWIFQTGRWLPTAASSGIPPSIASNPGGGGVSALGFGFYEGNDFARLKARFFRFVWKQFESTSSTGKGGATGQPAELQLYGRGFQPEVTLTSDLIRLGSSRKPALRRVGMPTRRPARAC